MKKNLYSIIFATPTLAVNINDSFKSPFTQKEDIGGIASILLSNSVVIAGVVFLFLIIIAGFTMLNGAGSGDPKKFAQGREVIVYALIGFLIIFASYWIIQIIAQMTGLKII